jgi:hypothetical protein
MLPTPILHNMKKRKGKRKQKWTKKGAVAGGFTVDFFRPFFAPFFFMDFFQLGSPFFTLFTYQNGKGGESPVKNGEKHKSPKKRRAKSQL